MSSNNDLTVVLSNGPRNCWVALNEERTKIIGRGDTMEEAVLQAQKNGVDDPFVLWVPAKLAPAVY